jgi:hypothetical protein
VGHVRGRRLPTTTTPCCARRASREEGGTIRWRKAR